VSSFDEVGLKNNLYLLIIVNLFDLFHLHPPGDKDEDIPDDM